MATTTRPHARRHRDAATSGILAILSLMGVYIGLGLLVFASIGVIGFLGVQLVMDIV